VINQQTKTRINKRQYKNSHKKVKLVVEACVYVHYGSYLQITEFLNSNNLNYIRMYLTIYFSNIINTINKIYKRLDSSVFKLEIEFVKLMLQSIEIHELNLDKNDSYLDFVNKYFHSTYKNASVDCDHIFFIHNFTYKNGRSQLGRVIHKF